MLGWWQRRKYPDKRWLDDASEETRYTPDQGLLEGKQVHLLFLPCELQQGHRSAKVTSECGLELCNAFTLNKFQMFRDREKGSAVVLPPQSSFPASHRVKGELWAIIPNCISVLDRYKKNGVECSRTKVDVLVPYRRVTHTDEATKDTSTIFKLTAWTYQGIPEHWNTMLDGGFKFPAVRVFRPNNPFLNSFFHFHSTQNVFQQ